MIDNSFFIILKKELTDICRDKRSLIMILLPIIMIPFVNSMLSLESENAVSSLDESLPIAYIENEAGIEINDIISDTNICIYETENPFDDLKRGNVLAIVKCDKDTNAVIYDESSFKSLYAYQIIDNAFNLHKENCIKEKLNNIDNEESQWYEKLNHISFTLSDYIGSGNGTYVSLLPMIIIIFAFLECTNTSLDLFIGERERRTLELLLLTRASRKSIVYAKTAVVTIMSIFSIAASLIGYILTMIISSIIVGGSITDLKVNFLGLILLLFISVIFIFCISCIFSYISMTVKSVKEGQILLSIIGFFPIIIGLYSMLFSLCDVNNFMMIIPIFNMFIAMKEILLDCYNYVHILIVIISYIVLSLVFLKLGVSRINSEKILSIDK